MLGHDESPLSAVTRLSDGPDDLGNDIAGLAQHDEVADAHSLAHHLGGVMKRGARDGGPGNEHRLHDSERGDAPGTPDLDVDVEQARAHLLGRVLVCGRPPGNAGRVSEIGLERARIELEDDPVDLMDEIMAMVRVMRDVCLPLGAPAHDPVVAGHGQPPTGQQVVPLMLLDRRLLPRAGDEGTDTVSDHGQRARGRHRRILLPKRAGRSIAGIGEDLQQRESLSLPLKILRAALLVESVEFLYREVDLAADLQQRGVRLPRQDQRHRIDGAHVTGDVLAHDSVTARCSTGQHAVLIGQCHCQAVDLDLGGHGQLRIGQLSRRHDALDPFLDLFEAEDILQGVKVLVVLDLGEVGGGASAHCPCRGIGQDQCRVRGLKGLQFAVHRVVFGI